MSDELGAWRGQIRWLVDRFHVATPDDEVAADIRRRVERALRMGAVSEAVVEQAVTFALQCHRENRELARTVAQGW